MLCKFCGAPAEEIAPKKFHCQYCSGTFTLDEQAQTNTVSVPNTGYGVGQQTRPSRTPLSGEQIYDSAVGGVVEIQAWNKGNRGKMCSSGFVVSPEGFVLTNAHAVIDDSGKLCQNIEVKSTRGVHRAVIVAVGSPEIKPDTVDLCLLYVEYLHVNPSPLGDSNALRNGQKVYLIGNSLGEGTCITSGIISDRAREIYGLSHTYIMTDAAANHGNSGGPLFNEQAEVIGVLVAGIDGAKGMNFAIPSLVAKAFITYVLNHPNMRGFNCGGLKQYSKVSAKDLGTLSVVFSGVRIFLDAVEYIAGLFGGRR